MSLESRDDMKGASNGTDQNGGAANGISEPKESEREDKAVNEEPKKEEEDEKGDEGNDENALEAPETEAIPKTEIKEASPVASNENNSVPQLRVGSISSAAPSLSHVRQPSLSSFMSGATVDNSHIFKSTIEDILKSKDAKKNEELRNAAQKALDSLNSSSSKDPRILFDALKLTCESPNTHLKSKAIDLFAKLFDYATFENEEEKVFLTDASVEVIASCFEGEGTDSEVELQVVRALMHSILLMPCHGASLLKAVRQIYNIFIFSLSPRNQAVAQGILTQVIAAIFQRVSDSSLEKGRTNRSVSNTNIKSPYLSKEDITYPERSAPEKLTLQNLEKINDDKLDDDRVEEANRASEKDEDIAVKDAFLIFRAMCKLSVKSIDSDTIDMRSHSVRSKLLSLHIIHTLLRENIDIFLSHNVVILSANSNEQTRLINAVRQYLCLCLSRNAASSLAPVFELSLEIFWLIISNLRAEFKREIPVFWDEIYFPVAEMKTSTPHQKRYLLSIIERLCNDSRCIIEFYLNYDCESNMPNICEKIIDYLTKLSLYRVEVSAQQKQAYIENRRKGISVYDVTKIANLTSSTMLSKPPEPDVYNHFPLEYGLKITSIGCSVAFLRSLYSWAQKDMSSTSRSVSISNNNGNTHIRDRSGTVISTASSNNPSLSSIPNGQEFGNEIDDPEQFQNLKQRKKEFLEGVRQFNQKPKKGIAFFLKNRFITSDMPKEIASFLLNTDGLDKAMIGEYLGDGDEQNIAIMHAFADQLDFSKTDFVEALRRYLQCFRLPGEAQKIDRFMLKFAERYVLGNPTTFANADTAYVLAYSVIMLNTDLHSPQVRNRMTLDNFIMNNAGIDDGNNLSSDFLLKIYYEIQSNEIKLQSEQHAALLAGDIGLSNSSSLGIFGSRDVNREAYIHASKEMSSKTEQMVRNLGKKLKSDDPTGSIFYVASHVHHVRSIFDTLWMSILAGLTPPFKEYDDEFVTKTCLEGIKLSIRIACMFDLDYARTSFVGALVQFQNLHNFEEMRPKNVEAIYIMLELSLAEGDNLKSSWIQVLTSVSQLERLQLIAQGIDQDTIPDVSTAKLVNRSSLESTSLGNTGFFSLFTSSSSPSQAAANKYHSQHLDPQVALLLTKTELEVAMDKVFTNSANLSGEAIVDFVKALAEVSSEEIESSGQSANPRMFSLQKVVDVCYYNMSRIRLEWSHLWSIMGETFDRVGCHDNLAIVYFALDSLRQLSMRFLEIEELSHFKFQKEFLRPFEYVINNNNSTEVKDMVLECINNMILAKADKIKSGWKTILGVLTAAGKEKHEQLVLKSYKMVKWINKDFVKEVYNQESFADMIICFTQIVKNERFQKFSLLALDSLLKLTTHIANVSFGDGDNATETLAVDKDSEDKTITDKNDTLIKLWFPLLFGFHDIIMTGEELEVRSRALKSLFEVLMNYGKNFAFDFWERICHQLLFPIFSVLSNHWELSNFNNDKVSVWLSSTMIQALRSMITLFTNYFDILNSMLDEYLDLLISCICQENDTIARIGRTCLHTLLIDNCERFNEEQWGKVTNALGNLFELTRANELFTSDPLKTSSKHFFTEDKESDDVSSSADFNTTHSLRSSSLNFEVSQDRLIRSREKSTIVVKCVLQLLMIETMSELFENEHFYEALLYKHADKLASFLEQSYIFAKEFNDNYDLRLRLWNAGIIERLPNLLKQESSSAAVYLNIMFRVYCDDVKVDQKAKQSITQKLIPLCSDITLRYASFDDNTQARNIVTWRPVVIEIFQGFVELDDSDFVVHAPAMYRLSLDLISKCTTQEFRETLENFLARIGDVFVFPKNEKDATQTTQ